MNEKDIEELRTKILNYFKEVGFEIGSGLKPKKTTKNFLRKLHEQRRIEQLKKNRRFICENIHLLKRYYEKKEVIYVDEIELELRFIETRSEEYTLFKLWNLIWWSLPYERSVGRQMRYMLFDVSHGLPFGIVTLQSPILRCEARDKFLGIDAEHRDYWINQSLYAQRVGALPPYNIIGGGRMVAMSLSSQELRYAYREKYEGKLTAKKKRIIPARLLFVTTFSAYGRSKIYENLRCRYPLSIFVGWTKGAGTFHIPDSLYDMLLSVTGEYDKSAFVSSSRKLKLITRALQILGLENAVYHHINRAIYIFPHAQNIKEVITKNEKPKWLDLNFRSLFRCWKESINVDRIEVSWDRIRSILHNVLWMLGQ